MFKGLCCVFAILLLVADLPAQEGVPPDVQALADSLRRVLECPADITWPELPDSVPPVFSIDPSSFSDSAEIARPDITVPQYAYFYGLNDGVCKPVVIVQAQGEFLGHISAVDRTGGSYFAAFYDLLGTDKPRAEDRGSSSYRDQRASAPHHRFVIGVNRKSDAGSSQVASYTEPVYLRQHALFWDRSSRNR